MSITHYLAFWNLENLFDIENSPRRSDKLKNALGNSIQGWTQQLLDTKISQLASIVRQMNAGRGPDILGVCEVENDYVMNLLVQALNLPGRDYQVEHHDMSDRRGIDVGFIYDDNLFTVEASFSHFVMRRTATRDIFQVNFRTPNGRLLVLVGNHWPSRSGGKLTSDGYRAIAGETLAYFHQRIREIHGTDTPVLAMGDFNDEPFDTSLVDYALSLRDRTKVINATTSKFLNLMWSVMGQGIGSYYFDNYPNLLDQFLVNKNMLKDNEPIRVLLESVEILRFPEMVHVNDYPVPIPFGGMGKPVNQNGFSDHYPISVTISEED